MRRTLIQILFSLLSFLLLTLIFPISLSYVYGVWIYQEANGQIEESIDSEEDSFTEQDEPLRELPRPPPIKSGTVEAGPRENSQWFQHLQQEILSIDRDFVGELGVFVKDLSSGEAYSLNAVQGWYYASVIKIFVLIEVMRQRELGLISLDQLITVNKDDFRDGAGQTHLQRAGSKLKVQTLVERMMMVSDNSATDLLISLVGLEQINQLVKKLFPQEKIGEILTMLEVRYRIFEEMHPSARNLSNQDFIAIKQITSLEKKMQKISSLLRIPTFLFQSQTVDEAYRRYYAKGWNTGSLELLGHLLEMLYRGQVVSQAASEEILKIMRQCRSGEFRVRAGLPKDFQWAHKTGTQHARSCDVGIATSRQGRSVVIAVCARNFKKQQEADQMMQKVAEAVLRSGVFGRNIASQN